MSRLSSAATATTTTKPTMMTDTHRVCSVGFIGRSPLASQPGPSALQPGDDDGGVLDGGAQRAERRGVADGAFERGVDLRCLVADLLGEHEDGRHEDDDGEQDDAADHVADGPVCCHRYTVSQKSRTGLRLALTEVSRSGTVLVSWATAWTPPVVATSVARTALRWKMTRSRPTAVMVMISAATISVNQAAAGMAVSPSSAEQLGDGARVPDRADGDFLDRLVGDGQRLGQAVQLADEGDAAGQDVVGRAADPLHRREHAVEQEDHHRQDHDQQDDVTYPPKNHDRSSSARGLVGQEEAAEHPAQSHHRGSQAQGEA